MMRPLTAVGVYYIRPSLYPAKFSGYPAKPGQVFRVPGQTSLPPVGAFCSFSCVKTRKGEEQGLLYPVSRQGEEQGLCPFTPVSRQEKEKNRGFAPLPPPSFLPLMEEKKAKEDQGVRDAGQVFRVPGQTSLPRQGTSETPANLAGYVMHLRRLTTRPLGRNYRGQSPLTTVPEWAHNYLRPTGR